MVDPAVRDSLFPSSIAGVEFCIRGKNSPVENDCTRIEALCRFAGLPGKERTVHDCAP